MASSTAILVKRDSTSNKTFLYLTDLVEFYIKSGKINVSLIVNLFLAKGLKYFAISFEWLYM